MKRLIFILLLLAIPFITLAEVVNLDTPFFEDDSCYEEYERIYSVPNVSKEVLYENLKSVNPELIYKDDSVSGVKSRASIYNYREEKFIFYQEVSYSNDKSFYIKYKLSFDTSETLINELDFIEQKIKRPDFCLSIIAKDERCKIKYESNYKSIGKNKDILELENKVANVCVSYFTTNLKQLSEASDW